MILGRKPSGWNRSGFKMSKEQKASLPGKESRKKKADMTPEELEQHLLFRRSYERIYRAWNKENDAGLADYQAKYHQIRRIKHPEEARAYDSKMYHKHPEIQKSHERKRRAREANVISEPYTWNDIVDKWGSACYLCGLDIDLEAPRSMKTYHPNALHLDHVIPIAMGGPDIIANVKPTHAACNLRRKKSETLEEIVAKMPESEFNQITDYGPSLAPTRRGRKLKD